MAGIVSEGKHQYLHPGKPGATHGFPYIRGNHSQVFGHHSQGGKPAQQRVKEITNRDFHPLSANGCLAVGGDLPAGDQSAKMVNAYEVKQAGVALQSL